ncbi:MAG: endo alpha-1,4 polygalactosaminidase [Campylobacteraceae bacterium]|nr:endo alpha-1,4 polygalactosaminidase [Campylobacteraceae bacterium]
MRILLIIFFFVPILYAKDISSVAFYYGSDKSVSEFNAFDAVVVDGDNFKNADEIKIQKQKMFAYVSVGEADKRRAYFKQIPKEWLIAKNSVWKSAIIDQSQKEWATFFVRNIIKPLKDKGFDNFFFDTLDSYQIAAKTTAERKKQEDGLIAVVTAVKTAYPDAKIIFNRGFEILPKIHGKVSAVAAESLFGEWNEAKKRYENVKKDDREWLVKNLKTVTKEYKIPAISIEYVEPKDKTKAREIAKKVKELGFIPYVTNGALDMLGIGAIEVQPRRILMIYDKTESPSLSTNNIHLYAAMPLNYMGYKLDYVDVGELPNAELSGMYAGIVTWLDKDVVQNDSEYREWIQKQINSGVKIAVLDYFGFDPEQISSMGIKYIPSTAAKQEKYEVVKNDKKVIGFETKIKTNIAFSSLYEIDKSVNADVFLSFKNKNSKVADQGAFTDWGGYALYPNVISLFGGADNTISYQAWILNPFDFFTKALNLKSFVVPDVTTENGKRLFFVHVDGDSFVSQIEYEGGKLAGQKMYEDIFSKYKIPQTVSVIEAETAPHGIYPKTSNEAEKWAKEIYKLPYIEAATHTFSHPFVWSAVENGNAKNADSLLYGINLKIKDYKFNFDREITGSTEYMQNRLLPKGKKVKVILWTGDCIVGEKPLKIAKNAGLLGMNGGDTTITKARNTISLIAPLGRPDGDEFQVYAPNQNENVYTNNWTGSFYGYEKAIETFELTDKPHRYKPINIYYHFYSATKIASINSLKKAYDWALKQDVFPIYTSEYIQKAQNFNSVTVAKDGDTWIISGADKLREVRVPKTFGYPNMQKSIGVLGFNEYNDDRYIHLSGSEAKIVFDKNRPLGAYIQSINAHVEEYKKEGKTATFYAVGYTPIKMSLANSSKCKIKIDGKSQSGALFAMSENIRHKVEMECKE